MGIAGQLRVIIRLTVLPSLIGFPGAASAQPMMRAAIIHEYGGAEVLKLEDVPRPEPKENEVLVKVIAAGVNPADPLIVSGRYAKEFGTHLPLIPGYDIAGLVEKIGSKITKLKVGDAVYGYVLWAAAGLSTQWRRKAR
jgi:NADPH:quinone reductase-like Zn-dependent oxidoreductase